MLGKMSWFCADKSGLLFYRAASDTRKDELFCADDYGKKICFCLIYRAAFHSRKD